MVEYIGHCTLFTPSSLCHSEMILRGQTEGPASGEQKLKKLLGRAAVSSRRVGSLFAAVIAGIG